MKLLVSTLICTYNAEEFFDATIRSVLDQTYKNQEILIRDDCSSDRTVGILQEWAEKDNRIRLFIEPGVKKGPYGGLNYLLDNAKGKYIAIQDHDDIRHPEKLDKQVDFLENNQEYEGVGSYFIYDYTYHKKGKICKKSLSKKKIVPGHPTFLFRQTLARYNTEYMIYNDYYFMLYGFDNIYIYPEVLCLHKMHKNNLSSLRKVNCLERYTLKRKMEENVNFFDVLGYIYIFFFPNLSIWLSIYLLKRNQFVDSSELYKRFGFVLE